MAEISNSILYFREDLGQCWILEIIGCQTQKFDFGCVGEAEGLTIDISYSCEELMN